MRRPTRLVAVLAVLVASAVVGTVGASAAPPPAAAPASCGSGYPVTISATIEASTTTPFVGQTIEVSGVNYVANEDVKVYLRGRYVLTAHTDASGRFDPPMKVTGPPGDAELTGIGAAAVQDPCDQSSLTLSVQTGAGVEAASTSRGANGGGLPFTGVQTALLIALALLLLGGGGAMLYVGRRRNAATIRS